MRRLIPRKFFFLVPLLFLLLPLGADNADDGQIIKVRKGDTISYLSFKIYGQYDPLIGEFIRKENPKIKNINLIYVGQEIKFPGREAMRKWLQEKSRRVAKPVPILTPPQVLPEKEALPEKKELPLETKVRANKAVITYLSGEVQVKRGDSSHWTPAQANMILHEKDQIRVLAESRAELILDNQSVVRLRRILFWSSLKSKRWRLPEQKIHASTSLWVGFGLR